MVNVDLPTELHVKAKVLAAKRNTTVRSVYILALTEYFKSQGGARA